MNLVVSQSSSARFKRGRIPLAAAVVFLVACASFFWKIDREPHFIDESAYISQTYFFTLLSEGKIDDSAWIEYPAVDLPPLPKYLIGMFLVQAGERIPGRDAARAWYLDQSIRCETDAMLWIARYPSVLLGGIGCAAIFAIGRIVWGRTSAGLLAALFLAINPLYRLHARRAMADVPAEAMILCSIAIAAWAWRAAIQASSGSPKGSPNTPRLSVAKRLSAWVVAGGFAGLAVLAKLNGGLGLMTIGAIAVWGSVAARRTRSMRLEFLAAAILASAAAFVTFAALNPTVYARPVGASPRAYPGTLNQGIIGRCKTVIDHRIEVSRIALSRFRSDALPTLGDKCEVFLVQGFGRFGPFGPARSDSRIRFDFKQDRGASVWAPIVLAGLVLAAIRGIGRSEETRSADLSAPPGNQILIIQTLVAWTTVVLFLPLAWDRYLLSIQPAAALAAAGLVDSVARFAISFVRFAVDSRGGVR